MHLTCGILTCFMFEPISFHCFSLKLKSTVTLSWINRRCGHLHRCDFWQLFLSMAKKEALCQFEGKCLQQQAIPHFNQRLSFLHNCFWSNMLILVLFVVVSSIGWHHGHFPILMAHTSIIFLRCLFWVCCALILFCCCVKIFEVEFLMHGASCWKKNCQFCEIPNIFLQFNSMCTLCWLCGCSKICVFCCWLA